MEFTKCKRIQMDFMKKNVLVNKKCKNSPLGIIQYKHFTGIYKIKNIPQDCTKFKSTPLDLKPFHWTLQNLKIFHD